MNFAGRNEADSPQFYARTGGLLYLILILVGMFSVIFVRGRLIVALNADVTVVNIAHAQLLWRIGIVADLVMHILDIPIMLVLYVLLRPVHKNLALLALLFNLIQTAVLVMNKLNLVTPLFLLGGADYLKAFDPRQLHTLIYLSLKMHDYGFGVGLIFFGFTCLVNGYLIIKSKYLPAFIGLLLQIGGLCYLVNSFALILNPSFQNKIFPAILIPVFVAELTLSLRLLIRGVNMENWELIISGKNAGLE